VCDAHHRFVLVVFGVGELTRRDGKLEVTWEMGGGTVEATTDRPAFWRWEGFIKADPAMSSTIWPRHVSSKDEAELPHIVVDTNVFISFLPIGRCATSSREGTSPASGNG
jgi:hypothetical protein